MKNLLIAFFLILFSVFIFLLDSCSEKTAEAQAPASFTCYAESSWSVSHYTHPNRNYAARRAVEICQVNTPPYGYCSFIGCNPY